MAIDPTELEAQIAAAEERVAKGVAWLSANDPSGGQYFRVKAGLTSLSPMPSLSEDDRQAWIRWYDNYRLYEQLMGRLERLEARRKT